MKRKRRRLQLALKGLAGVIAFFSSMLWVNAADSLTGEGIDKDKTGNIIVERSDGSEWPLNGTVFYLYKIADLNEDAEYSLTEQFLNKKIQLPSANDIPSSQWEKTTDELMVESASVEPLKTERWSGNSLTFSNLPVGLYLLRSSDETVNRKKYVSQGNLISIPNRSTVSDNWSYSVSVEVKHTEEEINRPTFTSTPMPDNKENPEPSEGVHQTPNTGDSYHGMLYACGLLAAVGIIAVIVRIRANEGD